MSRSMNSAPARDVKCMATAIEELPCVWARVGAPLFFFVLEGNTGLLCMHPPRPRNVRREIRLTGAGNVEEQFDIFLRRRGLPPPQLTAVTEKKRGLLVSIERHVWAGNLSQRVTIETRSANLRGEARCV